MFTEILPFSIHDSQNVASLWFIHSPMSILQKGEIEDISFPERGEKSRGGQKKYKVGKLRDVRGEILASWNHLLDQYD